MLANGHLLLEGVPGLAKTLMVKTLAQLINTNFQRIQFTPDMLPADLIGTLIYNQKTGEFDTRKGPIFSNIILADEIFTLKDGLAAANQNGHAQPLGLQMSEEEEAQIVQTIDNLAARIDSIAGNIGKL